VWNSAVERVTATGITRSRLLTFDQTALTNEIWNGEFAARRARARDERTMSNEQDQGTGAVPPTGTDTTAQVATAQVASAPAPEDEGISLPPPAQESPAAMPTPASDAAETATRPRVQLQSASDMKAVPSVTNDLPPIEGDVVQAMSAEIVPTGEKVDIPSKRETSLDEGLEAEINSVMAGNATGPGVAKPPSEGGDAPTAEELKQGQKFKGRVQSIHADNIIVDLGPRASGLLQAKQFEEGKLPEIGATIDVVVEKYDPAEGLVHLRPGKATVSKPQGDWNSVSEGQIVDCVVTKSNKGGLEVNISHLRGFLPASQVDFGFVQSLDQYIGQKLRVKITEVNPQKRNLVVSRRAFLETERAEKKAEVWGALAVGQTHTGVVKTIKDYGAFVDIGGVDGLLHVGELSWTRINHPKDVLAEGQRIEVKILGIDQDKQKVSLGMRQLTSNPWLTIAEKYAEGTIVKAKVTKAADFGAFVELEPGVEGLVHISELEHRRINRVTEVVQPGQEIELKVLSVDLEKKRIALSKKALIARPESEKKAEKPAEPPPPPYERKNKGPLRGGGTGSGGGLLFGSPTDR
jgi:small subunit ribosomal protein S1